MKRHDKVSKIEIEIPAINTDKEGRLLGGFSAFGVTARGTDNGVCENNPAGCKNNGKCSSNSKGCSNNTTCSKNFDTCNNNDKCTNGAECNPTTPKGDTTTAQAGAAFLGGSMLF